MKYSVTCAFVRETASETLERITQVHNTHKQILKGIDRNVPLTGLTQDYRWWGVALKGRVRGV